MFNIGPLEIMVLAIVGLIVVGPDRLPGMAKDAANMLRTLRELATGARKQFQDELGPEFADLDLRNLNPRTAVQRAVFGDDVDLGRLNPRNALRDAIFGDEDVKAADPRRVIRETRFGDDGERHDETHYETIDDHNDLGRPRAAEPVSFSKPVTRPPAERPRPRPRPTATYDSDAT